jgi:leader peptidase (prepilin peptidase) / N-methyltransferase
MRTMLATFAARPRVQLEATIAGAAIIGVAASLFIAPDLRGVLGAALALVMLAIAAIDARHFIIPNELNAAALLLALLNAVVQDPLIDPQIALTAVAGALLRGLVLALCFLALRIGYRRLRRREGIGLGDVKLAAVAGAWLDWLILPTAIEIAAISALALYAVRRYVLGRPFDPKGRMPFGLFLAPAIWLGWLGQTAAGAQL